MINDGFVGFWLMIKGLFIIFILFGNEVVLFVFFIILCFCGLLNSVFFGVVLMFCGYFINVFGGLISGFFSMCVVDGLVGILGKFDFGINCWIFGVWFFSKFCGICGGWILGIILGFIIFIGVFVFFIKVFVWLFICILFFGLVLNFLMVFIVFCLFCFVMGFSLLGESLFIGFGKVVFLEKGFFFLFVRMFYYFWYFDLFIIIVLLEFRCLWYFLWYLL